MAAVKTLEVLLHSLGEGDTIQERLVELSADKPLTVGRASEKRRIAASANNTAIDNPVVSKDHAILSTDPGCTVVFVKDQSTHGTWLNDKRLLDGEQRQLESGSVLQFGTKVIHGQNEFAPAKYRLDYRLITPTRTVENMSQPDTDIKRGFTDEMSDDSFSDDNYDEDEAALFIPDTYDRWNAFDNAEDNDLGSDAGSTDTHISNDADDYEDDMPSAMDAEIDYPDEESSSGSSHAEDEEGENYFDGFPATPPGAPFGLAPATSETTATSPEFPDKSVKETGEVSNKSIPFPAPGNVGFGFDWSDISTANDWPDCSAGDPSTKYASPYVAIAQPQPAPTIPAADDQIKPAAPKPFKLKPGLVAKKLEPIPTWKSTTKPFQNSISEIVDSQPAAEATAMPTTGSKRTAEQAQLGDLDALHKTIASEAAQADFESRLKQITETSLRNGDKLEQCLEAIRAACPLYMASNARTEFGSEHYQKILNLRSKWLNVAREKYFSPDNVYTVDDLFSNPLLQPFATMLEASDLQPRLAPVHHPTSGDVMGPPSVSESVEAHTVSVDEPVQEHATAETVTPEPVEDEVNVVKPTIIEVETSEVAQQPPQKRNKSNFLRRARDGAVGFIVGGAVVFGALASLPESLFA